MKWIGLSVLIALVALAVWAVWPRPIPVDLAVIEESPLEVVVSDDGVTRIKDIFTVSAPVGGRLMRSPLKEGDTVVEGETVVATILPGEPSFLDARSRREGEAMVEVARAALNLAGVLLLEAEAKHDFALADLRRAKTLRERGTISARELEEKELQVARSDAEVGSSQATLSMRQQELESARARLVQPGATAAEADEANCCIAVRPPVSGVVIDVAIESEQTVAAGTPLIDVGNLEELEVVVELLSREAVRVTRGDRAWLDGWGGDKVDAVVRRVEPAARTEVSALGIEEQRVEVILDPADQRVGEAVLGHNYRVVAHVVVWEVNQTIAVPLGALFRSAGEWTVFQVVDGRAVLTPVELGERSTSHAQILSGLDGGATVIVHPSDAISDGIRVEPRRVAH